MKKIIMIIMAVVVFCGIFYIGYLIFGAANVKEIEIVGQMQQIYFVGDEVNFGNAKLKVTYQNGNQKMIDMAGNVDVSLFSTSGYGKYYGTMKIAYKTQTVDVDYTVLDRTSYIVSSEKKITATKTTKLTNSTKRIIDFKKSGICKYFEIKSGEYYVHDGAYDESYKYKIKGDKIYVNLGDDLNYEISAKVEGNQILVSANSYYYADTNSDIIKYIIETEFETTNLIKTNNYCEEKTQLKIDTSKCNFDMEGNILLLPKGNSIKDANLCLEVDYDNGETYYVYITNEMLIDDLYLGAETQSFNIRGYYESRLFVIVYKII